MNSGTSDAGYSVAEEVCFGSFLYCSETDVRQRKAAVSMIAKQVKLFKDAKTGTGRTPKDAHETYHIGIL